LQVKSPKEAVCLEPCASKTNKKPCSVHYLLAIYRNLNIQF